MKKRYLPAAAALILALTAAAALAVGGTTDDPLISLSYLTGTFTPSLLEQADERLSPLEQVYDQAAAQLKEKGDAYLAQSAGGAAADALYSAGFSDTAFRRGDALTLPTGSGFLLRAGSAKVTHNGTVIDVTAGSAVTSGSLLTAGHRYLVGEDTSARFYLSSEAATAAVEGTYTLTASTLSSTMPFVDVAEDDWFHSAVSYAYAKGLFSGTSDNTFSPNRNITRAMVVTVLYQRSGRPAADTHNSFTDVSASAYYAAPVTWATGQGFVAGVGGSRFAPDSNITREQLACMLYGYAKSLGLDTTARGDLSKFSDQGKVSSYAVDAVSWAVGAGIITGTGASTLSPGGTATRAQAAAMLRVFDALT